MRTAATTTTRARLISLVVLESAVLGGMLWMLCAPDAGSARAAAAAREHSAAASASELQANESFAEPGHAQPAVRREVNTAPTARTEVLVYGRVVDSEGNRVENAQISLVDREGRPGPAAHVTKGEYAVFGVAPGAWQFRADAQGYRKSSTAIDVAAVGEQRADLELAAATVLHVHAQTPDGTPLRHAIATAQISGVSLCAVALDGPLPPTLPAVPIHPSALGVGKWMQNFGPSRSDDRLGDLELQVDPPVHVALMLGPVPLAQKRVTPGTSDVLFQISPDTLGSYQGSVRARIVSADKQTPIERAWTMMRYGSFPISERSDRNGEVRMRLGPGLWWMLVQAEGHQRYVRRLQLDAGQELDLGTIELAAGVTVRGHVIASDGRPARAYLEVFGLDEHASEQQLIACSGAQADAGGAFTIGGLGRGVYAVHARLDHESVGYALVDTTAAVPEDLRIELHPARRMLLQNRCPPHEVCVVSIRTRAGLPVFGDQVPSADELTVSLPPGEYVMDVRRNGTLARSSALVVGDGETTIVVP